MTQQADAQPQPQAVEKPWSWDGSYNDQHHKKAKREKSDKSHYRHPEFGQMQTDRQKHNDAFDALMDATDYTAEEGGETIPNEFHRFAPGERTFAGQPRKGMDLIQKLVVDLARDVKRIEQAATLGGATRMTDKMKNGWHAKQHDINGDGIDEVIVYDKYGNKMMINGYTTKKSDWPMYHAYHDDRERATGGDKDKMKLFPQRADWFQTRFGGAYKNSGDDIFSFDYTPEKFNSASNQRINRYDDKAFRARYKTHKPARRTAYQAFTSLFHEVCKGFTPKPEAKIVMKYAAKIWGRIVTYIMLTDNNLPRAAAMIASEATTGTIETHQKEAIERMKKDANSKKWFDEYVTKLYNSDQRSTIIHTAMNEMNEVGGGVLSREKFAELVNAMTLE